MQNTGDGPNAAPLTSSAIRSDRHIPTRCLYVCERVSECVYCFISVVRLLVVLAQSYYSAYIWFSFIHLFICRSSHFFMLFNIFMYFGIFGLFFLFCFCPPSVSLSLYHPFAPLYPSILVANTTNGGCLRCWTAKWIWGSFSNIMCVCLCLCSSGMYGKSWAFHHHKMFFNSVKCMHYYVERGNERMEKHREKVGYSENSMKCTVSKASPSLSVPHTHSLFLSWYFVLSRMNTLFSSMVSS